MADPSPADAPSLPAGAADRIRGFYINLDRSTDRRRNIEAQLQAFGLGEVYRRFPAVDGMKLPSPPPGGKMKAGEIGIFRSHHDLLAEARASGKFIHVLEDDALLSEFMLPAIDSAIGRRLFDRFDLIFTDIGGVQDFRVIRDLKHRYDEYVAFRADRSFYEKVQLIDLARFNFAATSSYVISPAGIDRLRPVLHRELEQGPTTPVDFVIRREVHSGRLRAACFFPFLTSIDIDGIAGTTTGRTVHDSFQIMALLRYSFFINRDLEGAAGKALSELTARARPGAGDPHHAFIMSIMSYVMSKEFKPF